MADPESLGGGWIFEEGLRPFCETIAEFSGYEFDDLDWQAVGNALPHTDVEKPDGWYDYPLSGRVPLTLLVADDPGSSVVFVRVTGNPDGRTRAQIEAALHIFSMYTVR
ncbi:hypothetical protein [Streptomyces sp. FXY-T5]|uniref:hypothetical protein n=1 Tax=Streptomyces sp. FXY-T5 TaxID=3064901 RepID=UPI0027D2E5E0|nr:hypothetical protein [Streptomyces sp. FXY-T5]WMD03819.1 hypothetical protein Q7C01_05215 [Streptomyces sp. FXY-T5]